MLRNIWVWVRRGVLIFGVLLSFFAVIECIRAYQTLHNLHVVAGYLFLGVLCVGGGWLIWWLFKTVWFRPAVLSAPPIRDTENPSSHELKRYGKYLMRYMERLQRNELVLKDGIELSSVGIEKLQEAIDGSDEEKLKTTLSAVEQEQLQPLLRPLDEEAEREVRRCVRDVMATVAFSPYKALDLAVVIYRNLAMAGRIVRIYNSRPRVREQLKMMRDIAAVVATVNYIDLGRDLLEHLGSHVPGIGRYIDNIAEGTGAGFMTSIVGHAAIQRCRAYKEWDQEEACRDVCSNLKGFYSDVKDMFKKDVLPKIMSRVADTSRETWDKVVTAMDETGSALGNFVTGALGRKK